jgi:hypothetical protein
MHADPGEGLEGLDVVLASGEGRELDDEQDDGWRGNYCDVDVEGSDD